MQKNQQSPETELPIWFDGKNINEALFCQESLREHRIIFTNRAFFTPDGRVTDDLPLRGEIYESLKSCVVNNIPPYVCTQQKAQVFIINKPSSVSYPPLASPVPTIKSAEFSVACLRECSGLLSDSGRW